MRRTLAFLLLGVAEASAGDPVVETADAVLRGGDLRALAARDDPDPWLVADELCARGRCDEAEAFAKAAPRKDVERLPEYVATQRARPTGAERREALRAVKAAMDAREWERAIALTGSARTEVDVTEARLLHARGAAHKAANRLADATAAFRASAGAAAGLGWLARQAMALREAGDCAYFGRRYPEALAAAEEALKVEESRTNRPRIANALANVGVVQECLGNYARALEYQERALKLFGEIGDRAGVAAAHGNMGNLSSRRGEYPRALEHYQEALRLMEELGDRVRVAVTLLGIGSTYGRLGEYAQALERHERALKVFEEFGIRPGVATAVASIGLSYQGLGDYRRALEYQQRALQLAEEIGDRAGVATTLGNIGVTCESLGDFSRALEYQKQALRLKEELGDRAGAALTLQGVGSILWNLGEYPRALECLERGLKLAEEVGDLAGTATALGLIGLVHESLGDYARALECQQRALKLRQEVGDRAGVAHALANIGVLHECLGELPQALECQRQALKLKEDVGDRVGFVATLANIGTIHARLGDCRRALEYHERARKLAEELGRRAEIAATLANLGKDYQGLGDHAQALDYMQRALAVGREIGDANREIVTLWNIASLHHIVGRHREAARFAREAVVALPTLVRGLGEQQAAVAREQWADLFDVGVSAAVALNDAGETAFFLESGRAGSLLESLGGRDALRSRAVPEALQALERDARASETAASKAMQGALSTGDREEVRARREQLDRAQAGLEDVIARIQREAKAGAVLAYGRVDSLEEIQGRVREGEALVLYGPAAALVVTRDGARIVKLEDCEAVCAAGEWTRLRALAVDPLGFDPKITRILVSPVGPLSQAPFCLLAPDKEVAYVPSGTTYGLLLDEGGKRGDGVLALGDPDYGTKPDAATLTAMRGGVALEALPATREEAKAVGDTLLLGGAATETGLLSAIGSRPRWRAIHLACHGLVNHKRAQLSSLALSGGDFLTVLEVFGTRVPADLVVLSACETAKGTVHRAEGVMGFVRAFMFAGAPRVIVSLWKVDDEATKALMVKFYELWRAGKPAAAALKEAQRFVASQEKWKDPKYWAAWQLWGLAE